MHRAIRCGTVLATLLLGAGCENQPGAPAESNFIPRPTYISVEAAGPVLQTTRVTGYSWDPEAWLLSFLDCTQSCLPPIPALPPLLLGNNPLFIRSVVGGTPVKMVDLDTGESTGVTEEVNSDPLGLWTHARVPSRARPYYPSSKGGGMLLPDPFPILSPIPPATYLPTVSLRPVVTEVDDCMAIELPLASDKGILEAVAKHLTAKGTATEVSDLINPTRYAGVTVFWLFSPGISSLRLPAFGTTVEPSAGTVLNVNWAPPGLLPPSIQSTRGFFVDDGAPVSGMGIIAVLVPAGSTAPASVTYSFTDPVTDAAWGRPYRYQQIQQQPLPGVITFASLQLDFVTGPQWAISERNVCLPAQ
jgi:hypothetical protein